MAQWERILNEPGVYPQLVLYSDSIYNLIGVPIEVREIFAPLIEDHIQQVCYPSSEIPNREELTTNPEHHQRILEYLAQLGKEMEAWVSDNEHSQFNHNYVQKFRQAIPVFKDLLARDPIRLFIGIIDMIQFERTQFKNPQEDLNLNMDGPQDGIKVSLEALGQKLRSIRALISSYRFQPTERVLTEIYRQFYERIRMLCRIQSRFTFLLSTWKLQEQHKVVGLRPQNQVPIELKKLQPIAEYLYNFICTFLRELYGFMHPGMAINFNIYIQQLRTMLKQLVQSTFIVIEQPMSKLNNVIKISDCRFHMTLCQLIGKSLFPDDQGGSKIKLSVINETEAKLLHSRKAEAVSEVEAKKRGKFCPQDQLKYFQFDETEELMLVKYKYAKLIKVTRTPKTGRGTRNTVMEEKYCILCRTEFQLFGEIFQSWTTTLPITLSSHKTQNIVGLGVIIWDYATGKIHRPPFEVSEFLPWKSVERILSSVFRTILELSPTDPGLSPAHLQCLKRKAYSNLKPDEEQRFLQTEVMSITELNRRKFGVESPIVDKHGVKGFSFWDWFYLAIKLLNDKPGHHKNMWRLGFFQGFIDKTAAESLITKLPVGAFILRFPDSITGAISIIYNHLQNEEKKVLHLDPYTSKRLEIKSLVDSIKELKRVKYICTFDGRAKLHSKNIALKDYYSIPKLDNPYYPRSIANSPLKSDSSAEGNESSPVPAVAEDQEESFAKSPDTTDYKPNVASSSRMECNGLESLGNIPVCNDRLPPVETLLHNSWNNGSYSAQEHPYLNYNDGSLSQFISELEPQLTDEPVNMEDLDTLLDISRTVSMVLKESEEQEKR